MPAALLLITLLSLPISPASAFAPQSALSSVRGRIRYATDMATFKLPDQDSEPEPAPKSATFKLPDQEDPEPEPAPKSATFKLPDQEDPAPKSATFKLPDQDPEPGPVLKSEPPPGEQSLPFGGFVDGNSEFGRYANTVKSNVLAGEAGERGELYVLAQFGLLLCIAVGAVPLFGDALALILGPGLIFAGLTAVYASASDLGNSLSPWPVPAKEGEGSVRDGAYRYVRHPMYSGLLCGMAGLGVYTDSATRLLLTAALFYALDKKASYEEGKMMEKYPDYEAYMKEVPGKFVPDIALVISRLDKE